MLEKENKKVNPNNKQMTYVRKGRETGNNPSDRQMVGIYQLKSAILMTKSTNTHQKETQQRYRGH